MMNAANAYNDNKVLTATPEELTLMLYEGAIKFCNIAIMAINNSDIEKANLNIQKAEDIIIELKATLDFSYSISQELEITYDYILNRLIESNISKSIQVLEEALGFIRELRDTWKEAMKLSRQKAI